MKREGKANTFEENLLRTGGLMAMNTFETAHKEGSRCVAAAYVQVEDMKGKKKTFRFTMVCEPQVFSETSMTISEEKHHTSVTRLLLKEKNELSEV